MSLQEKLRGLRPGSGGTLFGLVIGLLVGVMVSALVFPKDVDVSVDGEGSVVAGGPSLGGEAGGLGAGTTDVSGDAAGTAGQDAGGPAMESDGATPADAAGPTAGAGGAGVAGRSATASGPVTTLKIGVGVLDLGIIANLGPAFDNGDGVAHMRAWLAGVRREGLLPRNGYEIEFVYRSYDPIQAESQRAACRGFVQDDRVLAVLAGSNFQLGAECVAREFRTPLVTSDGVRAAAYERAPMLFTFMPSKDRVTRNWAHWAHRRNELEGNKIGVLYVADPDTEELALNVLIPELEQLGYTDIATAPASTLPTGGPQDAVAAQRFRAEGVDVIFLMGPPTAFTQTAAQQGYRPKYLASDLLSGTTNTATSNVSPENFDGATAMTAVRYGEWKAGMPASDRAAKCAAYYEAATGRKVVANEREAEWIGMNKLCDGGWALLDALAQAPPGGLDKPGLAAALEELRGSPLGVHPDAVFEPGRHEGARSQRTLGWHADCQCWKAVGRFEPFPLG